MGQFDRTDIEILGAAVDGILPVLSGNLVLC